MLPGGIELLPSSARTGHKSHNGNSWHLAHADRQSSLWSRSSPVVPSGDGAWPARRRDLDSNPDLHVCRVALPACLPASFLPLCMPGCLCCPSGMQGRFCGTGGRPHQKHQLPMWASRNFTFMSSTAPICWLNLIYRLRMA